jgi:hypothetical protein
VAWTPDRRVGPLRRFAALEREVHNQACQQADLYVAGLVAQAGKHL